MEALGLGTNELPSFFFMQTQSMSTLVSSETNEWYTPPYVIKLVKEVLGFIELDPASCLLANVYVGAKRFYTKEEDGLSQDWLANTVFLNPPFGRSGSDSLAGIWLNTMLEKYNNGEFAEGIALTHTRAGYEWWEDLFRKLPVCLTREKIRFVPSTPIETTGSKTSQTFFYFGRHPWDFERVFSSIGRVILP